MRFFLSFFLVALTVCCVVGCKTTEVKPDYDFKPTAADKLTPDEQKAIVWHARQFVADAKQVKLTDAARRYIRATEPTVVVKYFAPKYGQMILTWRLSPETVMELRGTGYMTDKKFPWKLEIKTMTESHPLSNKIRKNMNIKD